MIWSLTKKPIRTPYSKKPVDEKQAFKDASKDMRQWFEDNYGNDWLQLLESSVAQCSRQSG